MRFEVALRPGSWFSSSSLMPQRMDRNSMGKAEGFKPVVVKSWTLSRAGHKF